MRIGVCDPTQSSCVAVVEHSRVEGADGYVVEGSGSWTAECTGPVCRISFTAVPAEPICDFRIYAVANGVRGEPSEHFCLPRIQIGVERDS